MCSRELLEFKLKRIDNKSFQGEINIDKVCTIKKVHLCLLIDDYSGLAFDLISRLSFEFDSWSETHTGDRMKEYLYKNVIFNKPDRQWQDLIKCDGTEKRCFVELKSLLIEEQVGLTDTEGYPRDMFINYILSPEQQEIYHNYMENKPLRGEVIVDVTGANIKEVSILLNVEYRY